MKDKSNKPDWNDAIALIGLLILGTGIWLISPPYALISCGFIVMLISLARSRGQ